MEDQGHIGPHTTAYTSQGSRRQSHGAGPTQASAFTAAPRQSTVAQRQTCGERGTCGRQNEMEVDKAYLVRVQAETGLTEKPRWQAHQLFQTGTDLRGAPVAPTMGPSTAPLHRQPRTSTAQQLTSHQSPSLNWTTRSPDLPKQCSGHGRHPYKGAAMAGQRQQDLPPANRTGGGDLQRKISLLSTAYKLLARILPPT